MRMLLTAVGAALVFATAAAAQTPRMIAMDSNRTLYELDLSNGARTLLGTFADGGTAGGLAYDCATQTMYMVSTSTDSLYRLDVAGLTATLVGAFGDAAIVMHGLEWDSSTGTLYGASSHNGGLYTINTTTGQATLVGTSGITGASFINLMHNSVTNTMYATSSGTDSFYTIDRATGVATLIGPLSGSTNPNGLAFNHLNGLHYIIDNTTDTLYTVDVSTGAVTVVGLPGAGNYLGLAMIAPCPVFSGADVAISVADSPDPIIVPPGGNITYTITVTNNGPETANDVVVTNVLPANVTFQSVTAPGVHNAGTVTANFGTLTNGQQVSFQVVVTPSAVENVTNTATVATSSTDNQPGNNSGAAFTTVRPPSANISALITGPTDCTVSAGGVANYSIAVNNAGPEAAENVTLAVTIPSNVTFVTSIPAGTVVGDTLTVNLGSIAAAGGTAVTAEFTVNSGATVDLAVLASASTFDTNTANNGDTDQLLVPLPPATSATIKGLFSTVGTSATSDVPGQPGVKYSILERPFISPDGTKWVMNADTNAATGQDDVVLSGVFGGSHSVIAQEGVTMLPEGDILAIIPSPMGINDSGHVAFNADTNNATSADEVVVKWDGVAFTTVVREGTEASVFGVGVGVLFGGTMDSVSIQNDGSVSFYSSLTGIGTTSDTAYFTDSGATVLAQEGVTVATNQANAGTVAATLLQTGSTEGTGLFVNATGSTFCGIYNLLGVAEAENRVLVVDNDVKIQEGHLLPGSGFISPVASASPITNFMSNSGRWMAIGSNADSQDWVVRNGAVIAKTGDPIVPGSDKLWGDTSFPATFFMVAENNAGDYVVGGVFNGGDASTKSNAALVLNGTTIIARENDPVDLDGNGIFDDAVYLRTFVDDRLVMTADAVYAVIRIRSEANALCGTTDTDAGMVFVRIPISSGPVACNAADIATAGNPDPNAGPDGFLTGDDFDLFINAFFNELQRPDNSLIADLVDGDGNPPPDGFLTGADFDYFIDKFFAGC